MDIVFMLLVIFDHKETGLPCVKKIKKDECGTWQVECVNKPINGIIYSGVVIEAINGRKFCRQAGFLSGKYKKSKNKLQISR